MICELYNRIDKWYWGNDYSDPKEEVGLFQFFLLLGALPALFIYKIINDKIIIPVDKRIKFRCNKK